MQKPEPLAGRRLLVSAGPTREPLDPVRFLSNRSSGKMGFAVAQAAQEAGAVVTLVAGPVWLPTPEGVERIDVETAREMSDAIHARIEQTDIFISAAAVADYRPRRREDVKIKKHGETMRLELVRNPDIVASVASLPGAPFTVGFAAETENVQANARSKLVHKKLDMIAANRVGDGLAFDADDNELSLLWQGGALILPKQDKLALARAMLACIGQRFVEKQTSEGAR